MSLTIPSTIRELPIKLYRTAKNEHRPGKSLRPREDSFVSYGEASRKAGCLMWPPELCGVQPANPVESVSR